MPQPTDKTQGSFFAFTTTRPVAITMMVLAAVVFGLVSSCATGIFAGYLPARQAAAMDPVEALRHE